MANKKVWKYYVNGKEVSQEKATQVMLKNQKFLDLISEYPNDDECVEFWLSRIKDVTIKKDFKY